MVGKIAADGKSSGGREIVIGKIVADGKSSGDGEIVVGKIGTGKSVIAALVAALAVRLPTAAAPVLRAPGFSQSLMYLSS